MRLCLLALFVLFPSVSFALPAEVLHDSLAPPAKLRIASDLTVLPVGSIVIWPVNNNFSRSHDDGTLEAAFVQGHAHDGTPTQLAQSDRASILPFPLGVGANIEGKDLNVYTQLRSLVGNSLPYSQDAQGLRLGGLYCGSHCYDSQALRSLFPELFTQGTNQAWYLTKLPDFRQLFLRGFGSDDQGNSSAALGQRQGLSLLAHTHTLTTQSQDVVVVDTVSLDTDQEGVHSASLEAIDLSTGTRLLLDPSANDANIHSLDAPNNALATLESGYNAINLGYTSTTSDDSLFFVEDINMAQNVGVKTGTANKPTHTTAEFYMLLMP